MNDTELEAWLASRLGSAPSPEPSPRLVLLVHAGRRAGGATFRRPSPRVPTWFTAGHRGLAGLVGLAACVILAGGLLFGISARMSQHSSASASPSISATASPSASPRPIASATSIATPTAVEATVVAHVAGCQDPLGWDYTVSGNDLFVVCDASNSPNPGAWPSGAYVARVDLATNKVTATYKYKIARSYVEGLAVYDGSLWFVGTGGSACVEPCHGFMRLERFDVASGKNTVDIPDVGLVGNSSGYIWVEDLRSGPLSGQGPLRKLDPKTGQEKGRIPFDLDRVQFVCGSLWGATSNNSGTADASTTVARVDPADGAVLARFTLPGSVLGLESVGGECWASVAPDGADPYTASEADHFVRIGDAGIEDTSPRFDLGNHAYTTFKTYVDILGGSFWLVSDDGSMATLQRLDPSTWRPTGKLWHVGASGYQGDPFAIIGGSVWVFDTDGGISRLDIPLG
jgi:hypothetical protein